MDGVTFSQQHFGQKRAVLAGDAGNKRDPVATAAVAMAVAGALAIDVVKAVALGHTEVSLCPKSSICDAKTGIFKSNCRTRNAVDTSSKGTCAVSPGAT